MNDTSNDNAKVLDFAPRYKASDTPPPPPAAPPMPNWRIKSYDSDSKLVVDEVSGYIVDLSPIFLIASADAKTATPNDFVYVLPAVRLISCARI